jgi:hypothetical protein
MRVPRFRPPPGLRRVCSRVEPCGAGATVSTQMPPEFIRAGTGRRGTRSHSAAVPGAEVNELVRSSSLEEGRGASEPPRKVKCWRFVGAPHGDYGSRLVHSSFAGRLRGSETRTETRVHRPVRRPATCSRATSGTGLAPQGDPSGSRRQALPVARGGAARPSHERSGRDTVPPRRAVRERIRRVRRRGTSLRLSPSALSFSGGAKRRPENPENPSHARSVGRLDRAARRRMTRKG